LFDKEGLSPEKATEFIQSIDWSKANALNASQFKEDTIKTIEEIFGISEEKATEYYDLLE